MHQWDFSLKRANFHVVDAIQATGTSTTLHALSGCILVDSTRRGKRYPDALAKTVPIWCAVLNRASHALYGTNTADVPLMVPADAVSASERAQMEARLGDWRDTLLASDWTVPRLEKPLCPLFVHPGDMGSLPPNAEQVHHVVLVSASAVSDIPGEHGAVYVQGAGDDHESWALGLTPELFWRHRSLLLDPNLARSEREMLIRELVVQRASETQGRLPWLADGGCDVTWIGSTCLAVAQRPLGYVFSEQEREGFALIIHASQPASSSADAGTGIAPQEEDGILRLGIPEGKRGLNEFSRALPNAVEAATDALLRAKTHGRGVLVCCTDGCHVSGGLVVAVLAASFDEHRALLSTVPARSEHRRTLSKDITRRRLQWVVGASERISPSRAHLQRVNAFLIGPHRAVRME